MVLQFQQKGGMRGMAVGTPVGKGNGPNSDWTDWQVDTLKTMWAEGASAGAIAKVLSPITRSAILGKARRLKLQGRGSPASKARVARAAEAQRSLAPRAPAKSRTPATEEISPQDPLILADGNHATVLTINDRMCRWPIGDPGCEDFHFCGHRPREGSPYCEAHAEKAYDRAGTKRYQERVALARAAVKK